MTHAFSTNRTPAKAGVQVGDNKGRTHSLRRRNWAPAFAGVWLPPRVGLIALLLALLMRLAVPTGFMWESAPGYGARLIPCSGMAPAPIKPDAHAMHHMAMAGPSHEKGHEGGDTSNRECAFSALGGALDLANPFVAPAKPLLAATALPRLIVRAVTPGRGLAAPPPPSRGPPATV